MNDDAIVKTYHTYAKPLATKCKEHSINQVFDETFYNKNKYEFTQQEITKLFFDIDITHDLAHQIRKDILKQLHSQKGEYKFVYTDGSTKTKASFHIIFYEMTINKITFKKEMAYTFLKDFFYDTVVDVTLTYDQLFKCVDNSVYQRKTFLRLPYATDNNKPNRHIPNEVSDMKRFFVTYTPIIKPFDCEPIPEREKIIYKGTADSGENDPVNKAKYTKNLLALLSLVKKQRFQEYAVWRDLLFLMKGRGLPEELFIQYSFESEYKNFDENSCRDKWDRCDAKPMIGLTRVIEWCKEDGIDYMFIYTQKEIKDKNKKIKNHEDMIEENAKNNREQEEENCLQIAYIKMKELFEEKRGKILSTGEFLNTINGDRYIQSKSIFMTTYEHEEYHGLTESVKFINRWIKDVDMKTYDKIDCIPHTLPQNPRILNSWIGFPLHNPNSKADYQPFMDFIKNLVNNDELVYNYIVKEIAHSIQYPHEKLGTMFVFAGEEGSGKGCYWDIRQALVGKYNCLRTPKIDEVAGKFNSLLKDKYLICLNENEFKASKIVDGVLKDLITDSTVNINVKNQSPYEMNSYHRFIMFTNSQELPVQTHKGDRRKLIIQTSSEHIGDKEYFIKMYSYISDSERIAAFYNHLMTLDVKDFRKEPLPITEYQKDVQEVFKSPVELWVEHLAFTQIANKVQMTGSEQYISYTAFRESQGINLELSSIALSMKLKLLKIGGVSDIIKGRESNYREFDKKILRQYFKLD